MSELHICRFCFGDENQEDLISPCGCTGTMEFVHKDCLSNWLINNRGDKRYFQCNECKKDYKRLKPSGQDAIVDFEMSIYTLSLALGSALLLIILILCCGVSTLLSTVILIILYIITVSWSIIAQNTYLTWFFIILFICLLYSPRKIKTFVLDLWLILAYGTCAFGYIDSLWNVTKQCVISNYMSRIKPQIYDNYTKSYVNGVI